VGAWGVYGNHPAPIILGFDRAFLTSLSINFPESLPVSARRLSGMARGVSMTIEMEPFSGAENDSKIHTKITVAPNTERACPSRSRSCRTRYTPADRTTFAAFQAQLSSPGLRKRLVGSKTPAALPGRENNKASTPDQQMQCRQCEIAHGNFMLSERLTNPSVHAGDQVDPTMSENQGRALMNQRLQLQVIPHIRNLLTTTHWPTTLTRLGGDRNTQISEFLTAFKWHIQRR
jgi:hypothetical protein